MEFSSFFFHLLFFGLIFQLSNTIVSSTKVEIPAEDGPTDKLDSLTEQIPSFDSSARTFNKSHPTDADIGQRLVQQRIKRGLTSSSPWNKMFGGKGKKKENKGKEKEEEESNKNLVYIDHRKSGCLAEPRNQGRCRASYVFATIAFYEWLNCQKTGEFQAFSEQYIIDCGHRHGNQGCVGGNPVNAIEFINDCGLAFGERYPFRERTGNCYYDIWTPYGDMGDLYIKKNRLPISMNIPLSELAGYLELSPIIVVVEISSEFYSYNGGVDDNVGHTPELLHTMLLIGHGVEDGKDYWLFRNSYSALPLYKLNKNIDCFSGEFGIGLDSYLAYESDSK